MKTLFAALVLSVAPAFAFAQCSGYHDDQVVMSCPQGQMFDTATNNCVPLTTS